MANSSEIVTRGERYERKDEQLYGGAYGGAGFLQRDQE